MLYLGLLILGAATALLVYEYGREKRRRAEEYSGACELLSAVCSSLEGGAAPLDKILSDFSPKVNFAEELRERLLGLDGSAGRTGGGFRRDRISGLRSRLDGEDAALLSAFFSDYGRADISYERKRARDILSHFERREREVGERTEKDIRVAGVLLATSLVGILIMAL